MIKIFYINISTIFCCLIIYFCIFGTLNQTSIDMTFSFHNAICKRCPYFVFKQCHYKKSLYKRVPARKSSFKFKHRCRHYRNIFKVGQPVLVNLYNLERLPDGTWDNVLVHKNVPGIIKGFTKNKFIVEFFKAYFFKPRKQKRTPDKEVEFHFHCLMPAKDITPILLSKASIIHMLNYRVKMKINTNKVFMN